MLVKDFYEEKGIKAKPNVKGNILMWVMAGLAVLSLIGALFIPLCLVLTVIAIVVYIMLFRRRHIEYDYCFMNDEIEIAEIMNSARRRKVLQFQAEEITLVAPADSVRLDNEKQMDASVRVKDFTSEEPTDKVYGLVVNQSGKKTIVMMELTDTMMKQMKQLIPHKVYAD